MKGVLGVQEVMEDVRGVREVVERYGKGMGGV
jgi:hypothetical protein